MVDQKKDVSGSTDKPKFDEQTLARVLEAAYVLQQHNRDVERKAREREKLEAATAKAPVASSAKPRGTPAPSFAPTDYAQVLAQIVATQQQIQARQLNLNAAMSFVVERAAEIARADGAGVAILEGVNVRYGAAAGELALPAGSAVPMEKSLCAASLRVGQVVRCEDVNVEFLVDLEECRRRGIQSMISAPVFVDGNVAGALELYYGRSRAFTEPDVHTCQLMAGVVAEALTRERNPERVHSPCAAGEVSRVQEWKTTTEVHSETAEGPSSKASFAPPETVIGVCSKCGSEIMAEEQFCGICGMPARIENSEARRQQPLAAAPAVTDGSGVAAYALPENPEADLSESLQALDGRDSASELALPWGDAAPDHPEVVADSTERGEKEPEEASAPQVSTGTHWTSAAAAREFLEQLSTESGRGALARFLRARRGDIYVALAVIVVAMVIRWGIWSSHPVTASGDPAAASHRRPEADLPLYDRILIKLGLAEAPEPSEYKGNPNTQVWVDERTGLYYCPGADLYGKTLKGRFSAQKDAQLDEYQPAARRACD
jgi:putative methionine-R-sulfoxide reductase with GAF domain